jgi:hypothetical protein
VIGKYVSEFNDSIIVYQDSITSMYGKTQNFLRIYFDYKHSISLETPTTETPTTDSIMINGEKLERIRYGSPCYSGYYSGYCEYSQYIENYGLIQYSTSMGGNGWWNHSEINLLYIDSTKIDFALN